MSERKEAWMRIVIGVISGIILSLWKLLIEALGIFHWFYVLFVGKRNRSLAEFSNIWTTQTYRFVRYMTFTTNSRPFPFSELGDVLHPIDIKSKK